MRSNKRPRVRADHTVAAAACALFIAGGSGSCAGGAETAPAAQAPKNLLFLVVDTLRADAVGWAGHPRPTTPVLDDLAAQSIVFEQAIAQSSWTRASMAALVTGLLPTTTGLTCHNFRLPQGSCDVLRQSLDTFGELFQDAGFATAGIVANINVDPVFGFDQGFDHYVCVPAALAAQDPNWRQNNEWLRATTEGVTAEGLTWLEEHDAAQPFVLYLHYLDPHEPYEPPEERRAAFPPADTGDPRGRESRALYDAELAYVDDQIGAVLAALEARGLAESTAIVVVSDHGEEFYEHGGVYHGWTMYDEQIRVPLLLHLPGTDAVRVSSQVRQVDVLPTLLDLFQLETPAGLHGASLRPLLAGAAGADRPALSEWGYNPVSSLRAPPWKLVHDHESGATQLYDLERDPGEAADRSSAEPEVAAQLLGQLLALRAEAGREAERFAGDDVEITLSDDKIEQLRALGYGD